VSGESFLRIAIRDQTTDKVGALEVSVADIKNLPAPTTPAKARTNRQPELAFRWRAMPPLSL